MRTPRIWILTAISASCASACGSTSTSPVAPIDASLSADGTAAGLDAAGEPSRDASLGDGGSLGGDGASAGGDAAASTGVPDACAPGQSTSLTGRLLDPNGKNPVAHAVVFVPDPEAPLPVLAGLPMPCGCDGLYPATVLAVTTTGIDGRFVLPNIPASAVSGGTLSFVTQLGKWRVQASVSGAAACAGATAPDIHLPSSAAQGDIPDIAISTGGADSLECLPIRMGIAASEYASGGSGGSRHIHVFRGYQGPDTSPASPAPYASLYDTKSDLAAHDLVLLSCEGQETTGGNPGAPMTGAYQQNLYDYVQGGGRVFGSHFHDAWFRPTADGGMQGFAAGNVIGSGEPVGAFQGSGSSPEMIDDAVRFPVDIDTTQPDGGPFDAGADLSAWLAGILALDNGTVPVQYVRENVVSLNQPPAQEWMHLDPDVTQATIPSTPQLFSVDVPRSAAPGTCGRIVYSDLHGSGPPGQLGPGDVAADYPDAGPGGGIVPDGCSTRALTAQESVLEYMVFELSSCLGAPLPAVRVP
jgi:hypothetical protein